jgi:hypothetical protein
MRPPAHVVPTRVRRVTRVRADIIETSYYVGQAAMYTVFFYSAFNWWYYHNLVKKHREDQDDKK